MNSTLSLFRNTAIKMGDWHDVASASLITFLFAIVLGKVISVIMSFRQYNLRAERERSTSPSAPLIHQAAARELETHTTPSDMKESDLLDLPVEDDSVDYLSGPDEKVDSDEAVAKMEQFVAEANVESVSFSVVDEEGANTEPGDAKEVQSMDAEANAESVSFFVVDEEGASTEPGDAKEVESMDAVTSEEAKVIELRDSKQVEVEMELTRTQEVKTTDMNSIITSDEKCRMEIAKETGTLLADNDDWVGVETTELEENFSAAASYVAGMALDSSSKVSNVLQLQFYALYKQATEGSCTSAAPPAYKLSARAKWQAWQKLGGNMSQEEAMQQYITLLSKLRHDWDQGKMKGNKNDGDQAEEVGGSSGIKGAFGPVFSMLIEQGGRHESAILQDMHRYAREGDVEGIGQLLEDGLSIEQKDSDGRTALHWAVDRGHFEIVKLLVSNGALINFKDLEGQTALHYATVCEREEISKYLLGKGADPYAHDNDGVTPCMSCPAGWIWMPGCS